MDDLHRELGHLLWEKAGMARSRESLNEALAEIPRLRAEFRENVRVPGDADRLNQELEKALRLEDFLDFAELLVRDALERDESCGGHFRVEHQTKDGEALRDDAHFAHVAAWEYRGDEALPVRHVEPLVFENAELAVRSYK